ncbi:MAG TPA: 3-carboxy-cis,cis-muconate cycloisomerase, partial [Candidatus Binatia bacterium]|nr:3-carboxy-cis,cis-muconate cycloisomerase [Candidatus Binatia bacterium]
AEAAVFALAKAMPRGKAEELVKKACRIAVSEGKDLVGVVRDLAQDAVPPGTVDWIRLGEPANYLGETEKIIDRVRESAKKLLG